MPGDTVHDPIGPAAAAHLLKRGIEPLLLESGPAAGAAVGEWSHVRLFSTRNEVVDPAAERLLSATGWARPDSATHPSGSEGPAGTGSRSPTSSADEYAPAHRSPASHGRAGTESDLGE